MVNTPNRNWPIPSLPGTLHDNGALLIAVLGLIDGDVQSLFNALSGKADLAGAAFTGPITGLAPSADDNSNKLPTTAWVNAAIALAKASIIGGASSALDTLKEIEDKFASEDTALAAMLATLALKANIADYAGKNGTVRNTVLHGDNANGAPNFLTTGSGLTPAFTATNPLVLSFADGFGSNGAKDVLTRLMAGTSLAAITASCISYLAATYVDASTVAWSATKAPPQYGASYNKAAQSCLKLNNNSLDDFGNTWSNNGVTFSNAAPAIAGSYYGVFNGSSNYLSSTAFSSLYPVNSGGGWTLRGKIYTGTLAAQQTVVSCTNDSGYGLVLLINTSGKTSLFLSSTGANSDIASVSLGTSTLAINTWYDYEITYDPVAGKFFVYIGGTLDNTLTSASRICSITRVVYGASWSGSAYVNYWNGRQQAHEFLPYCAHPNGTTFTVPTTLPDVTAAGYASDWYDTLNQVMKSVSAASGASGQNPTFATSKKVYVGEAQAGASSVSSVAAYAFNQTGKNGYGVLNSFGFGQGWADVTASRAFGTTYFNTDTVPMEVVGSIYLPTNGACSVFVASPDRPTVPVQYLANSNTAGIWVSFAATVPPKGSYSIRVGSGSPIISQWAEFKRNA